MQAAKRVAKNTGLLYARMAITVFISLYSTRLVLAAMGTKDFGIFNLVGGTIALLGFLNASMAAASQRFMSYTRGAGDINRLKKIFNVSFVLHLIIALILVVVLEIAGYFFFDHILNIPTDRIDTAKLVYHCMIISTVFTVTSVPYDAVINANENMLIFAIVGLIESLLKLAIAFYITHTSYDRLKMYGILMAAYPLLLLIIQRVYCHKKYAECTLNFRKYFSKPIFKEMSSFAGWSFVGSVASMVSINGQGVVLNIFFGTVVNAAQGIANQIGGQLNALSVTMLKALNPNIAKSVGAGDRSQMLKVSMTGSKFSFFLLIILYVPVLIEMPFIFQFWLKKVPEYAIVFCRLLLINTLIKQCFLTLNSSILAVGNIKKYQLYFSLLTILTLPACYFLFSVHFPPYTLYLVFMVYTFFNIALILYFAKHLCGLSIPFFLKNVALKCLIVFIIMMIVSTIPAVLMHDGLLRLIIITTISTITFFFMVYFVGLDNDERNSIIRMVEPLRTKLFRKSSLMTH